MQGTHTEDCQRNFETSSKYKSSSTHSATLRFTSISTTWGSRSPRFQTGGHYFLATCEVCLRIFSQPEKYYRHIKEKHGVRREFFADEFASIDLQHVWQEVCDEKERLKDAAKYSGYESGRKATKKRLFYCKICKIDFGTDKGLFRHARNHHESDKSYSCKNCQVKFPTKFLLFAHEKECEKKDATYPCEKCETKFTTQRGLTSHVTITHGSPRRVHEKVRVSNGSVRYKCDLCSVLLASNQAVKIHKEFLKPILATKSQEIHALT